MDLSHYPTRLPWWYVALLRGPRFIFGKIGSILPQKIRTTIAAAPYRWIIRSCVNKRYDTWILHCFDEKQSQRFFRTCENALTLLMQSDPRRYLRVQSFVQNIILFPLGENGFEPLTKSIIINDYNPERRDLLAIALVHESTHAYLRAKGIPYQDYPRRHEAACLKEEYRSVKRIMRASHWISDEQRRELLTRWKEYLRARTALEWWKPDRRELARLGALRNLSKRISE